MKAGKTSLHEKEAADVTDRLERELQRRQEARMPGVPLREWARVLLVRSPRRGGGR
ncbi:hypothetical protein ACFWP7_21865 [Streptomyces sp. NPDC058470]|uniref:hypothetical protein n=1 Tax=Streptomyces sp. NPDC058470 TaxID=3346515 RepID=UPI00366481A3